MGPEPAVLELHGVDRRTEDATKITRYAAKTYSQVGEDGINARIFELLAPALGDGPRWCVEAGAGDGIRYSNTAALIRESDWHGVQVEPDAKLYAALRRNYAGFPRAAQVNAGLGLDEDNGLDAVLSRTDIPEHFDLLSLDVDGIDYHVWQRAERYRPRVLLVEFNLRVPHDVAFVQAADASVNQGASLTAFVGLARSKGYELACVHHWNAWLVERRLFPLLGLERNSVHDLAPDAHGRIWECYDGTLMNIMQAPLWTIYRAGLTIGREDLQVLPESERRWVNLM